MEINLVENIGLVHGVSEVVAGEDGFVFSRMTRELLEFYSYSEAAEIRAHCTSGVRICFNSNTSFVAMRLNYGRRAREIFAVDMVVDGMERLTFTPGSAEETFAFSAEMPLGGGSHTIEIHLPHLCDCMVEALCIEDGATLEPVKYNGGRIIFLGDSITQGMTSSSPVRAYDALLAAGLGRDFHNICVGGATMQREVGQLALDLSWKTAVVAFGVNDCAQKRPLEEFSADAKALFEALCKRDGAIIYALTPIPWPAGPEFNNLEEFREAIRKTVRDLPQVRLIEGRELVPNEDRYFIDGCHPNDSGMQLYAENLLAKINETEK